MGTPQSALALLADPKRSEDRCGCVCILSPRRMSAPDDEPRPLTTPRRVSLYFGTCCHQHVEVVGGGLAAEPGGKCLSDLEAAQDTCQLENRIVERHGVAIDQGKFSGDRFGGLFLRDHHMFSPFSFDREGKAARFHHRF